MKTRSPAPNRTLGRQILALALPALGALIAEPMFLLADAAIVGHLGVNQLAGVGLASTVLQTAVGLMVFLAYSTTGTVARFLRRASGSVPAHPRGAADPGRGGGLRSRRRWVHPYGRGGVPGAHGLGPATGWQPHRGA